MPPQDPQNQFIDPDTGSVVGYVYVNANDELVLREATNGNEAVLGTDGSFTVDEASIANVAAVAYPTSNQTISTGTLTTVQLDSVLFEQTEVADVDLANNHIDILQGGVYLINAQIRWLGDSGWTTGDRCSVIPTTNGSLEVDGFNLKTGTGVQGEPATAVVELSADDNVSVRVFQNSGAGKDVSSDQDKTRLEVVRIG